VVDVVDSRANRGVKVEEAAWSHGEAGSHKTQAEDSEMDKYYAASCLDALDQRLFLQRPQIVPAVQSPDHLTVLRLRTRGRERWGGILLTYPVSTHCW
jgi:hypothetical protein